MLDAVLDTGSDALPVKSPGGMLRFVRQIRAGRFDLAVSLVRSPLMSMAVLLSGIPQRAGLDSAGRGFGYNIRAPIDPAQPRHEADIYLDVPRALGLDVSDCYANIPVREEDRAFVHQLLAERGVTAPYMVINPAGGRNPGMALDIKRWPPENFAGLGNRLSQNLRVGAHGHAPLQRPDIPFILIGGPGDQAIIDAVSNRLETPPITLVGALSFGQIAALAADALVYVGNDTGLTHLAAASGAKTVMILGPSDPVRYAPFTPNSIALWKPGRVSSGGVWAGVPEDWSWARDGIGVDEAETKIRDFLQI